MRRSSKTLLVLLPWFLLPLGAAAQAPVAVTHLGPALLFDLSRALIPKMITQGGSPVAKVLEARYCGVMPDGAGRFLAAVQDPSKPRSSGRNLLPEDCSSPIASVASRLAAPGQADAVLNIYAAWKPWQVMVTGKDVTAIGAGPSKTISDFTLPEDTGNMTIGAQAPVVKLFNALTFEEGSATVCTYLSQVNSPVCSWPNTGAASPPPGTNLTLLLGHDFVADLVKKYGNGSALKISDQFQIVPTSYNYQSAQNAGRLELDIKDTGSGMMAHAIADLSNIDLSVTSATVDDEVTRNCGVSPSFECSTKAKLLGLLTQNALLAQKSPFHIEAVDKDFDIRVFGRTLKIFFQSQHASADSEYVRFDISLVVDKVE